MTLVVVTVVMLDRDMVEMSDASGMVFNSLLWRNFGSDTNTTS